MPGKSTILRCCLLAVLAGALFLVLLAEGSWNAEAKTITVDDDGRADYETIQDAVNASGKGDTIRVYEGIYTEHVVVNKSISLIGNESETTTIDGGGIGDVVQITADWVNMSEFSVTGSGNSYPHYDSGIKVGSNHCHVFNNTCSNNENGIWLSFASDCTVTNNTCENNGYGISLAGSSDSTISNNTCQNNDYGIQLLKSNNCTISNNTCSENNGYGIYLGDSSNTILDSNTYSVNNDGIRLDGSAENTITNNLCSENSRFGIELFGRSNHNIIENNTCSNNYEGIRIWGDSSGCILESNTCSNNDYGIKLDSSDSTITNNIMNKNGIYMSGRLENWNSQTIETTNTVNGKPVYYYKNVTGFTVPSGAGQVILANCSWMEVENQTCSNSSIGILIGYSSYITIEDNTCYSNTHDGIHLESSSNSKINNNTISENSVGIYLGSSSLANTAQYNKIYNNTEYGIDASYNDGYSIGATNNWWGHPSGPSHPIKNIKGEGDNISDYVEFDPWLEEETKKNDKPFDNDKDGGFLPGFGAALPPVAFVIAVLLPGRRRERKKGVAP